MNFSTKAQENMGTILAEEVGKLIEAGEIKDIEKLENGLREILKGVGAQAYGKILENEDEKLGKEVRCGCGGKAKRIMRRKGKILSVFDWVEYLRSYYGCSRCGRKHTRLDQDWGLRPGEVSPVMGKLLAIAGVDLAFEKARRKIKEFLLVEVSDNTIRKQTQRIGEKKAQLEEKWIEDSQDEAWLQAREREVTEVPERLYGSIDGALAPIGAEWRELKTLCWYRVAEVYGQKQQKAQQISYHSDILPADQFGLLVWASGVRQLADKAKELIFVCDGAAWIWKLVERYFPDAIQIVDWYHACEYLSPIAEAVFGEDQTARNQWLEKTKTLLWKGKTKQVIRACRKYLAHPAASQVAHKAVTYYTHNLDRMQYAAFREQGYWIGSGTVESACKQIATARLKISGARWSLKGAVATAKARAAWLSDGDLFNTLSRLPVAV
jgi:hypothetical protein